MLSRYSRSPLQRRPDLTKYQSTEQIGHRPTEQAPIEVHEHDPPLGKQVVEAKRRLRLVGHLAQDVPRQPGTKLIQQRRDMLAALAFAERLET